MQISVTFEFNLVSTPNLSHSVCNAFPTFLNPPMGYQTPSVNSVAANNENTPGALYGYNPTYKFWYVNNALNLLSLKYEDICRC